MAQTKLKNSKLAFKPSQIRYLFDFGMYLADLSESWLEEMGLYSKEFIKGLKESEKDLKEGRIKEAMSLLDL